MSRYLIWAIFSCCCFYFILLICSATIKKICSQLNVPSKNNNRNWCIATKTANNILQLNHTFGICLSIKLNATKSGHNNEFYLQTSLAPVLKKKNWKSITIFIMIYLHIVWLNWIDCVWCTSPFTMFNAMDCHNNSKHTWSIYRE